MRIPLATNVVFFCYDKSGQLPGRENCIHTAYEAFGISSKAGL